LHIEKIKIESLRNIKHAEISPHKSVNFIVGGNGAGKTTLLESIYLLARARSFRQQKGSRLIQEGREQLNLFTALKTADGIRHQIGLSKTKKTTQIRKDGENIKKLSELAKAIPLTIITPNIQRIIEEDPKHRRRLINWGMFHVEHEFGDLANRYKKALLQRNNALRGSLEQIKVWDRQLINLGEDIDRRMRAYIEIWNQKVNELIDATDLIKPITLELKQGWNEQYSLGEALDNSSSTDRERGFTSCGPQRSDLRVLMDGKPIKHIFSRGEAKMAAIIMLLSQTKIVSQKTGESPALLVDDLHAEIDSEHYHEIISLIAKQNIQSFITALNSDPNEDIDKSVGFEMFHVEHGEISAE
jgi:DNA replication and repair protein RecF